MEHSSAEMVRLKDKSFYFVLLLYLFNKFIFLLVLYDFVFLFFIKMLSLQSCILKVNSQCETCRRKVMEVLQCLHGIFQFILHL
jgi:hypothetical protein